MIYNVPLIVLRIVVDCVLSEQINFHVALSVLVEIRDVEQFLKMESIVEARHQGFQYPRSISSLINLQTQSNPWNVCLSQLDREKGL